MSEAQRRRLIFGILLTVLALPFTIGMGIAATRYPHDLNGFFIAVIALAVGVYLLLRFWILRRRHPADG